MLATSRCVAQEEGSDSGDDEKKEGEKIASQSLLIGIVIGVIFFIVIYLAWWIVNLRRARLKRPQVLIVDPIERLNYFVGRFTQINRLIRIPVSQSSDKIFWALETDAVTIIPAYGEVEDIVIDNKKGTGVKIMMAQIIGTTRVQEEAERAVKEWAKYAFPSTVWNMPPQLDLTKVPPNIVFVIPLYKREWGAAAHRKGLAAIRNIFGEVTRMLAVQDREIEVTHKGYGDLISVKTQSATEMIITMYYNVLKLWDIISEQRVLPWEVFARLVHLPMDQLNYTGLKQAIHAGNIHEIAGDFVTGVRNTLDDLAGRFNLTTMAEPTAKMLLHKMGDLQDKLGESFKREYEAQANIKDLVRTIVTANNGSPNEPSSPNPSEGRPPSESDGERAREGHKERPLIKMYDEGS